MKNAGFFLLSLAMALSVGGCNSARTDTETGERPDQVRQFGEVSRQPDPDDPTGQRFSLRVEANKEASLAHARILFLAYGGVCPDEGRYSVEGMSPEPESRDQHPGAAIFPAGTVFEIRIRCEPDFPQERFLDQEITDEEAFELLRAELAGDGALDPSRHLVRQVGFSDDHPKYPAIHKALGEMLAHASRACESLGVQVPRIVVLSPPATAQSKHLGTARTYLGVEHGCLGGTPAVASP